MNRKLTFAVVGICLILGLAMAPAFNKALRTAKIMEEVEKLSGVQTAYLRWYLEARSETKNGFPDKTATPQELVAQGYLTKEQLEFLDRKQVLVHSFEPDNQEAVFLEMKTDSSKIIVIRQAGDAAEYRTPSLVK